MSTKSLLNQYGYTIPVGVVLPFLGTSKPSGFLLCNGASYNKADYPVLAESLGTIYGAGTATTFVVPDLVNQFLQGASSDFNLNVKTNATTGTGDITITLTEPNIPSFTASGTLTPNGNVTGNIITSASNFHTQDGGSPTSVFNSHQTVTYAITTVIGATTASYTGTATPQVEPITSSVTPAHYALALYIRADYTNPVTDEIAV